MTELTLDQRFADAMGQLLGPNFPEQIALAVSGGGDSMAMLALAHNWARVWGVGLHVITVDHGLRAESAAEAEMVAQEAATLGRPHDVLTWDWDGQGNVQDQARRARLRLIEAWRGDIAHVLMAHTADDVAENFLMRLARGSGVEGLAAMSPQRDLGGFSVIRPCLDMTRAELRHYAKTLHVPWVEDPSNDDPKYDRARARAILPKLAELGVSPGDLRTTARRMARASQALKARAVQVAQDLCIENAQGVVALDRDGFGQVERDTQMRLLSAACMWVSGAEYRPRADGLESLLDRLLAGGAGTLIGAKAETSKSQIFIFREYAAVCAHMVAITTGPNNWDARWQITGRVAPDHHIAALGEQLKAIENWREFDLPRAALMALPAIWSGADLISAPTLDQNRGWSAHVRDRFTSYLVSH